MTTLAQLHDCHSCNDERSIVQKKKRLAIAPWASTISVWQMTTLHTCAVGMTFMSSTVSSLGETHCEADSYLHSGWSLLTRIVALLLTPRL